MCHLSNYFFMSYILHTGIIKDIYMQLTTFPADASTLILKHLSYEKPKEKALLYSESKVTTYRYKFLIPHTLNALLQCTKLKYSHS